MAQMVANGLLSAYGAFLEDLGKIRKGPKSTDFEQNAWAVVLKMVYLVSAGNHSNYSLKTPPTCLQMDF